MSEKKTKNVIKSKSVQGAWIAAIPGIIFALQVVGVDIDTQQVTDLTNGVFHIWDLSTQAYAGIVIVVGLAYNIWGRIKASSSITFLPGKKEV